MYSCQTASSYVAVWLPKPAYRPESNYMTRPFATVCGIQGKIVDRKTMKGYEAIMVDANKVLQDLYELHSPNMTFKTFCCQFFTGKVRADGILIVPTAAQQCVLDRMLNIKSEVIASAVYILRTVALSFAWTLGFDPSIQRDKFRDLEEEGMIGLMYAVYRYNNPDVKFGSFAWTVISNYLKDYYLANRNGMSKLNKDDCKLSTRVWEFMCSVSERITFDEACRRLKLNPEEIKLALLANRQCGNFSEYEKENRKEPFEYNNDIVDPDLRSAVAEADLTAVERDAFQTSVNEYHGWKSDVARRNVNPETGFNYTSASIGTIHARAVKKVRSKYDEILSRRKVA